MYFSHGIQPSKLPPSTSMARPHRGSAASEQRKTAIRPWSSGVRKRPLGTIATRSRRVSSSAFRSYMAVSVGPGQMALTLMPSAATS